MIICVCNNVSEKKIQAAVHAGMHTMAELRQELDVGTCCGKCMRCAKQVLHATLKQQEQQQLEQATGSLQSLLDRLHIQINAVPA